MTRRSFGLVLFALAAAAFVASSCGGGTAVKPAGKAQGSIAGFVFKAPVARATVTAYRTDTTLVRGEALGTATTADDGSFTLPLPPYGGPVIVVATGGSYVEEAIGLGVPLSAELATLVPSYESGSQVTGIRLHPVSTWALAAATYHVGKGLSLAEVWPKAYAHISAHVGGGPWDAVTPAAINASTTLAPEGRAALLLGALSQEGVSIALASKLSPGLTVNAGTMTQALADDLLADGTWNGVGTSGQLMQGTQGLNGQTLRLALSQGLLDFVRSAQNGTGLKEADVHSLAADLANATDPFLFCAGQDPAACTVANSDIDPPAITFVTPLDQAVARGSIDFSLTATDASEVKTLAFLAPAALVSTVSTIAADKHSASLSATYDVSALPDGDVTVQVRAADQWGNAATKAITLHVSNHGPSVTVSAPSSGVVVHGTIAIAATASPQGSPVASLALVDPPAGMGTDTEPTAAVFNAQWDTTKLPEGPATLRFRALDSTGGLGEASVSVIVDNVPLGVVYAAAWVGQPLAGAQVRLVAIDPLTGDPATGLDAGFVLGTATVPTDADGGVTFTLSQENYSGPVQLEATGANLSVTDPSDGLTAVAVPGAFKLTSYVPAYRTGDVLQAHATLWTTVADAAARAVVTGKAGAGVTSLPAALATTDALMSSHISRPATWSLRTVRPVSLTAGPQSLRDAIYASMPDVALHQLARDLSTAGQLSAGGVVTAFTLAQQLSQDVTDGLFDGKAGGLQLEVTGTPTYALDANTTRFKLAAALDAFVRGPMNKTGLKRTDLQPAGIFDAIASDGPPRNFLYPASPAPLPFDSTPPTTTFTVVFSNGTLSSVTPIGTSNLVGGSLLLVADAVDLSELASLSVTFTGATLQLQPGNTAAHFSATLDTRSLADGSYSLVAHACDKVNNCGDTTFAFTVDNTAPVTAFTAPAAGYYNASILVDAAATDAHGVASADVTSLTGFTDTNPAAERVQGAWTFPAALAEGPLSVTVKSCDVVGNCLAKTSTAAIVDKTPPAVTFGVSYALGASSGLAPVGAGHALGGTLTQAADAVDAAGVTSLSVVCGGAVLVPVAVGNTASHVASTLLTTTLSDGQRTLTAHSCDTAGNCGDTTYAFAVDNTPPVITVTAPVAGYYSASIAVDAGATDTTGVASLTLPSLAGFGDTDAAAGHIAGLWLLPAAQADGALAVTFNGCDLVGNCTPSSPSGVVVDRTAPALTWVTQPPAYSNTAGSITVSVSATDGAGAGISQVWFKADTSGTAVLGTLSGATWTASISYGAVAQGASVTVTAWGVDSATPANSGNTAPGAPAKLSATTLIDRLGPSVAVGAGVAQPSYVPESSWTYVLDGAGHPVVPVAYNMPGAAVAVSPGATIQKLGSHVHAADGNVPLLTYQLLTNGKAPLASAQLVSPLIPVGVAGCTKLTGCVFRHNLTLSTRAAQGYQYWDLPITWEMLDERTGPMTLKVEFTDAAGSVVTRNDALTLTLVPPPIGVFEDGAWPTANDPQSLWAYKRNNGTYANLFSASNTSLYPAGTARIVRYVFENPTPWPIAVHIPLVAGHSAYLQESWHNTFVDRQTAAPGGFTTAPDFTTPMSNTSIWDTAGWCSSSYGYFPDNCSLDGNGLGSWSPTTHCLNQGGRCFHATANSAAAPTFSCAQPVWGGDFTSSIETTSVVAATNTLQPAYFSDFSTTGNEKTTALTWSSTATGQQTGGIVPGAVGSIPGRIVQYLLVPLPTFTRAQLSLDPLTYVSLPDAATTQYQWLRGYIYLPTAATTTCSTMGYPAQVFDLNRWLRQLSDVSTLLTTKATAVYTGAPVALSNGATPAVEGYNGTMTAVPAISGRITHL